jgi:hypothetical protein
MVSSPEGIVPVDDMAVYQPAEQSWYMIEDCAASSTASGWSPSRSVDGYGFAEVASRGKRERM